MVLPNLDTSLDRLTDDLLGLGSMVEKALAKSLDALKRRDLEASSQVIQEDDE
jgi:phosphate transport system protein